MLNNFIGGGQIFLHKIRMFMQVFGRSFYVASLISLVITIFIQYPKKDQYDWRAAYSYQKASIAQGFYNGALDFRKSTKQKGSNKNTINAYTKSGLYAKNIQPSKILADKKFIKHYTEIYNFLYSGLQLLMLITTGIFILIFLVWSKYGKLAREDKQLSSTSIKSAEEVAQYLKAEHKASNIKIGDMPLIKDSETNHILITGSTGSGKTNLINNIIPQIIADSRPMLFIDQNGEMISKYYNKERGDIIFNPLDSRSCSWDFWTDTTNDIDSANNSRLAKFAKILFSYGKSHHTSSEPFWDKGAETIFCACVEYLRSIKRYSIDELNSILTETSFGTLSKLLKNTKAARYLTENNKVTANSLLSVMATNIEPLSYLNESGKKFSLREYFKGVANGSNRCLFLASAPDRREVTMPLIASIFELAVSELIGMGINLDRKVWIIIDELSSLGRIKSFSTLTSEGRKYGGCVMAATQSFNQLFDNFGQYGGSSIFGQFATKFIFRTDETASTRMISDIFGDLEYKQQQKNTSFGANELRDGIS